MDHLDPAEDLAYTRGFGGSMTAANGFLETVNRNFDAAASYLDDPP
jgi:hypothetical protein